MITKVNNTDIESFELGTDKKYIWADSPICHYCARYNFTSHAFDIGKCDECGSEHKNFLGVEALTWRERE